MRKNIVLICSGIVLLGLIIWLVSKSPKTSDVAAGKGEHPQPGPFIYLPPKDTSLVIWLKPGADPGVFAGWKAEVERRHGGGRANSVIVTKQCSSCDKNLMLLKGPAIQNFISTETASGGNGSSASTRASGGNGDLIYSVNYPVSFTDSILKNDNVPLPAFPARRPSRDALTVGVFDTGVDPDTHLSGLFYTGTSTSCFGTEANNGWNFTVPNANFADGHLSKHGTAVAALIAEQVYRYGQNSVKILPVKTHDASGKSDLFSILCGMSYAVNRGAKIINASFGFYAPRYLASGKLDSSAYLMKEYIKEYLVKNDVLLVAAAGNLDDVNEDRVYRPANRAWQRNLDSVCFYPASLARDLQNVFAVTTVNHSSQVSPHQNYSSHVVDVGVYADKDADFVFANPVRPGFSLAGSSFATPVVTGKLCANYYQITGRISGISAGTPVKDIMLSDLMDIGVTGRDAGLTTKINKGIVMKRQ